MENGRWKKRASTALAFALGTGIAGFAWAQDGQNGENARDGKTAQAAQNEAPTFDPNATAESLGLEPLVLPDDFFPLFPWDHLAHWGAEYQPIPEGIASMAECGFTMSAFIGNVDDVEICRKLGLKCILEANVERFDERPLSEEEISTKLAEIDAKIKERVESTKNDPTVLGYSITDEPGAYHFRSLAAAVAAIKKYAPGKLAYINLYPGYASTIGADVDSQMGTRSYREYLERFVQEVKPQFLSYDNYMIEYSEDLRDWKRGRSHFDDLFEVREVAQKYGLPFWYIGSSLCIMKDSSPPTPARYACQAYTALAAGAEGLTWFLYYPLGWHSSPIDKNGNKTLSWTYMREINAQAKALGLYLKGWRSTAVGITETDGLPSLPTNVLPGLTAAFSSQGVYAEGETPKLMVGEFAQKDGDSVAAMVVNLNFGTSVKAKFAKPDGFSTLKIVSPVDGVARPVEEAELDAGFWILPGHGTLFVWEK